MLPCPPLGSRCPEWVLASSRRCPVHKCLLEENQEAEKGKGRREEGKEGMEERRREG